MTFYYQSQISQSAEPTVELFMNTGLVIREFAFNLNGLNFSNFSMKKNLREVENISQLN